MFHGGDLLGLKSACYSKLIKNLFQSEFFLNVFLGLKLNRTEQYMNLLERGGEERERGVYVCVCVCVQSVLCLCVSLFFE